ncbi:MAG: GNAT family N-acetyltransferase, partial [Zoogloea sp.]|nr:GNAT family N-acetyltransferase [Zoogloea sp.]
MTTLTIDTADSAEAIGRAAWAKLCPPRHPFLNADFLSIVERHGTAGARWGWQARHLVARNAEAAVVGLLPLYLKSNSHGEFIHDWNWAAAYRQLGRKYYPKLFSGIPHTPVAGPRLLVADGPDAAAIRRALIDSAIELVAELRLSSWHVALPSAEDAAALDGAGLLASHDVQFQWLDPGYGDFDGYLAAFTADKRRKVKAERPLSFPRRRS